MKNPFLKKLEKEEKKRTQEALFLANRDAQKKFKKDLNK